MTELTVPETPHSRELIEAAEVLLERAGRFQVIQSEEDAALAAEFRARVNQQIKDLDAERLDMGSGIRATLEKINARFNTPIAALKAKLSAVDGAIKAYMAQQRALAAAAEQARQEQAAGGFVVIDEASNVPVEVWDTTKITGSYGSKVSTREVWKYRIVDIKKVPEAFLVPVEERVNKSALNAMARSMKGEAKVKGIEFYCEETLQSRVS